MCYDEYDDDYIDYDDLDDGEQYSYTNYEKEMKRRKQEWEDKVEDMRISEINCEIYTDVLVEHGFNIDDIEYLSERELYNLVLENDLIDDVICHERYGETW